MWDDVYDYLLTTAFPALNGIDEVFDGPPLPKVTPPNFAAVGDDGAGNAGTSSQDDEAPGLMQRETGEVLCLLVAQSGSTPFSALRAQITAWTDELNTLLRADKTLGGRLKGSTVTLTRVDRSQRRNEKGAVVEAVVAVGYQTLI